MFYYIILCGRHVKLKVSDEPNIMNSSLYADAHKYLSKKKKF